VGFLVCVGWVVLFGGVVVGVGVCGVWGGGGVRGWGGGVVLVWGGGGLFVLGGGGVVVGGWVLSLFYATTGTPRIRGDIRM